MFKIDCISVIPFNEFNGRLEPREIEYENEKLQFNKEYAITSHASQQKLLSELAWINRLDFLDLFFNVSTRGRWSLLEW